MNDKQLSSLCKDIIDLAQCELDTRYECDRKSLVPDQDELNSIDQDRIHLEMICPLLENAWEIRKALNMCIAMLELIHVSHDEDKKCKTCFFIKSVKKIYEKTCPLSERMAKNITIFTEPEKD